MKKQILVVGLGRLGVTLATSLSAMGHEVMAIDSDGKNVQAVALRITQAVQADATSEATLRELGAGNFDLAIVTIGAEIENSVLATILLKKLGVPYVIARANSELHGSILQKIGADRVVYPEHEVGLRVAHEIEMGDVAGYIPLGEGYGVAKVIAPAYFDGRSLRELGLGTDRRKSLAVLLLERGEEITLSPEATETLKSGDVLVISGTTESLGQVLLRAEKPA